MAFITAPTFLFLLYIYIYNNRNYEGINCFYESRSVILFCSFSKELGWMPIKFSILFD